MWDDVFSLWKLHFYKSRDSLLFPPQGGTNFSPPKPLLSCLLQAFLVDGSSGALQTALFAKQISQETSTLLILLSVLPIATINQLFWAFLGVMMPAASQNEKSYSSWSSWLPDY